MKNHKSVNRLIQSFYFLAQQLELLINRKEEAYSMRFCFTKYSKKHGYEICVTQIVHKNIWPEFTAEEIIQNKELLSQFSPSDIVKITTIYEKIKNAALNKTYGIVEFTKNPETGEDILLIQETGKNYCHRISCADIPNEKKLLQRFKSEDAYTIGFTNGLNYAKKVREAIGNAKRSFIANLKQKTKKLFVIK